MIRALLPKIRVLFFQFLRKGRGYPPPPTCLLYLNVCNKTKFTIMKLRIDVFSVYMIFL